MPTKTASKKVTVKCSRCGGAGRLSGFSHISGGTCFDCDGTGTMSAVANEGQRMSKVAKLMTTADIVLDAAEYGNDERADFYANMMIDDMLIIGTNAARKVLDYIGAGQYRDDTGERHTVPADAATRCRAYIITQGRARRAAA